MKKILFVCIHNSARSQMAEAWLNQLGKDHYFAESAGIEPGTLNPNVVRVMQEIGLDISNNQTKSVNSFLAGTRVPDLVITVCDESSAERCPHFPVTVERIHWSFPDPSSFTGSEEEILEQTRSVRDAIRQQIIDWLKDN